MTMPSSISRALAERVRARRLDRGWSRAELAARSGVAIETLKKFERTGQVSLERLVRLAIALGSHGEIATLFQQPMPQSLEDLERPTRKRGRTQGGTQNLA